MCVKVYMNSFHVLTIPEREALTGQLYYEVLHKVFVTLGRYRCFKMLLSVGSGSAKNMTG